MIRDKNYSNQPLLLPKIWNLYFTRRMKEQYQISVGNHTEWCWCFKRACRTQFIKISWISVVTVYFLVYFWSCMSKCQELWQTCECSIDGRLCDRICLQHIKIFNNTKTYGICSTIQCIGYLEHHTFWQRIHIEHSNIQPQYYICIGSTVFMNTGLMTGY